MSRDVDKNIIIGNIPYLRAEVLELFNLQISCMHAYTRMDVFVRVLLSLCRIMNTVTLH